MIRAKEKDWSEGEEWGVWGKVRDDWKMGKN